MQHAKGSHDSTEFDRMTDPRTVRRTDSEVVIERAPIVADAPGEEGEPHPSPGIERRSGGRRRIDRMSTGI